jgi:chemotaxis protein MotB
MASNKKRCDCTPGLPGWMATFADMMTFMMAFFVLLLSMASFDQQKIVEALGSLRGSLGVLDEGVKTDISIKELLPSLEVIAVTKRDEQIEKSFESIRIFVNQRQLESQIQVDLDAGEIILNIDSSILFQSGDAGIGPESSRFLENVVEILRQNLGDVRVEGHTDNIPIQTTLYPSNWELSTARAVNILRHLVEEGTLDAQRFSAVGYGEIRQIASNETPEGRAKNRRVSIVLLNPRPRQMVLKGKSTAKSAVHKERKMHFSTNLRKELGLKRGAK